MGSDQFLSAGHKLALKLLDPFGDSQHAPAIIPVLYASKAPQPLRIKVRRGSGGGVDRVLPSVGLAPNVIGFQMCGRPIDRHC